jgi:ubiquinone/menaquinone biosynthesis C-methylase UbiE
MLKVNPTRTGPLFEQGNTMPDEHLEAELAARIDPWLEHMRWREDFAAWHEQRLYQERYQEEHLASVRMVVGPPTGMDVLDLGAGMGGFSVALAREGAHVIVLEYNSDYCGIVRLRGRRYGLDLPVVRATGEALPLPDRTLDLVCSWDVLEHVQDPGAVLREVHRVLRPAGALLLTVINRFGFHDPHYHLPGLNWLPRPWAEAWIRRTARGKEGSRFSDRQSLSEMHYYTWRGWCRLARELGFEVEDLQEKRLRAGTLSSHHPWRRRLRQIVRTLGVELLTYRLARASYLPFFEVVLWKRG